MEREIIVHIGMPKTGTTTLQNRIFPNHAQYMYLGRHNVDYTPDADSKDRWLLSLKRDLVSKDLPYFEDIDFKDVIRAQFGEKIDGHEKLFLSEEDILARCINPGKYGEAVRVGSAYSIINKLHHLLKNSSFTKIKIILVLRRQDDLIESHFAEEYQNFSLFQGLKSPAEFVDFLMNNGQWGEADSLFRYHALVRYLDSLFGEENVLVLPYEKMKTDPDLFLSEFSSFMEIEPWEHVDLLKEKKDNSRDLKKGGGKVAKVYPMRNRLAMIKKKLLGNVSTGLGKRLQFLDALRRDKVIKLGINSKEEIMKRYEKENSLLNGRVKYLSEYGYFGE